MGEVSPNERRAHVIVEWVKKKRIQATHDQRRFLERLAEKFFRLLDGFDHEDIAWRALNILLEDGVWTRPDLTANVDYRHLKPLVRGHMPPKQPGEPKYFPCWHCKLVIPNVRGIRKCPRCNRKILVRGDFPSREDRKRVEQFASL